MLMIRDDVTEILVRNLKRLMAAQGMNPHTLAAAARVNQTAVYDIVSGKSRSPKIETVAKLAAALGTTVSTLIEEPGASDLRSDLEAIVQRLAHEEQERLLTIAQALLDAQARR